MAAEWLYVQLYPGEWGSLDETIASVVCPARAEALALGASRWFFIRYADSAGPHLRLRVRGEADALNAIHQQWRTSLRSSMAAAAERSSPRSSVDPQIAYAPYEPELEKYGGPVGVDLAEQAFEVCSEAVLELLCLSPSPPTRLAVTSVVMESLVLSFPRLDPAAFWAYHDRFWTPPGGPTAATPALPAASDAALCQLEARLPAQRPVASAVDRIAEATTSAITAALAAGVALPAEELLLHHLHMAVNRLGVLPAQEALLGRRIATSAAAPTIPRAGRLS